MTTGKDLVSNHISKLVKNIHTDNPHKKITPVSAALELLRILQQLDGRAVHELAGFYARVADVPWGQVQFSFTRAVARRRDELMAKFAEAARDLNEVALVLLKAIAVFSDILAENPAEATQEVFDAVVDEVAENYRALETKSAPAVFQPAMIERCFQMLPFDEKLRETVKARPVVFSGQHGVRHRGFLYEHAEGGNWLLLETGEALYDIDTTRTEPMDDESVTPLLACYLNNFLAWHVLGSFTVDSDILTVNLKQLVDVFDITREAAKIPATGATGPVGAVVRFPLRDMDIVFEASADTNGPYATAKLVNSADGTVLMRHEQPRENTPLGVYLFPLPNRVIVVRAVEETE